MKTSCKNLHMNGHSCLVCNIPQLAMTQMFIHGWMVNKVVHPHRGVLLSHRRNKLLIHIRAGNQAEWHSRKVAYRMNPSVEHFGTTQQERGQIRGCQGSGSGGRRGWGAVEWYHEEARGCPLQFDCVDGGACAWIALGSAQVCHVCPHTHTHTEPVFVPAIRAVIFMTY